VLRIRLKALYILDRQTFCHWATSSSLEGAVLKGCYRGKLSRAWWQIEWAGVGKGYYSSQIPALDDQISDASPRIENTE
jgi:hypothetical protein